MPPPRRTPQPNFLSPVDTARLNLNSSAASGSVPVASRTWNAVSDLGAVWNWDAATAVEGDDADECPESGPDWRNPKMEQFPSN
jgi:hypothetical protein